MAVDQADVLEAQVAEQPPDPRRLTLPLVVVDQDLAPGAIPSGASQASQEARSVSPPGRAASVWAALASTQTAPGMCPFS